jgi:hypothetical protein
MNISTNALLRLGELIFIDFFLAGVVAYIVYGIFNAGAETASLAAYLISGAAFLGVFKLMRHWVLVQPKDSKPLVKLTP